jgi:Ser/Thr protein kinase RdoA (MazF antagonist)
VDLEAARQLLPDLDLTGIAPLDGGAVHSNYALRTADGRDLVLKVYREELGWKRDKEAFLFRLIRDRLPIPRVVHTGPGLMVMTRLPGTAARFTDDDPVGVSRQLGGILNELHEIELEGFGYFETQVIDPQPSNVEFVRRRMETKLRKGPAALREPIARHFAAHDNSLSGCKTAVLCHNDAHDANVLVEDGRITGLVDWENAVAADPLLDLAKSWAFSDGRSEETLNALMEGYGSVRADWEEAFDLYVIDHLLELWVWFAQLGVTDPLPELEGYLARRVA